MAEIGLIASVIQVAGAGLKLSQTLYQYAETVSTADRRIKDIAKEVRVTSFVIDELGDIFKQDQSSNLLSKNAIKTADETVRECSSVFSELDAALKRSGKNKIGRLMLPFRESKIELLRSHIDKLKSTLQLLMQVLSHAHQIASQKLDREAEAAQREQIKALLQTKKDSTKRYEESLRNHGLSDDEEEEKRNRNPDSAKDLMTASSISSSITTKSLATCVQHIQSLLVDIEALQQVLSEDNEGNDTSEHHQNLVGSYFRAKEHLDSVLLGNPDEQRVSTTTSTSKSEGSVKIHRTLTGTTLHAASSRTSREIPIQTGVRSSENSQSVWTEDEVRVMISKAQEEARKAERERIAQEAKKEAESKATKEHSKGKNAVIQGLEKETLSNFDFDDFLDFGLIEGANSPAQSEPSPGHLVADMNDVKVLENSQTSNVASRRPIFLIEGELHTSAKPSGEFERFKQQTGLPSGPLKVPDEELDKVKNPVETAVNEQLLANFPDAVTPRYEALWDEAVALPHSSTWAKIPAVQLGAEEVGEVEKTAVEELRKVIEVAERANSPATPVDAMIRTLRFDRIRSGEISPSTLIASDGDEGEGRSTSEYEQWQSGEIEEGRLFFGPTNDSFVGQRRSSFDSMRNEPTSADGSIMSSDGRSTRCLSPGPGIGAWSAGEDVDTIQYHFQGVPLRLTTEPPPRHRFSTSDEANFAGAGPTRRFNERQISFYEPKATLADPLLTTSETEREREAFLAPPNDQTQSVPGSRPPGFKKSLAKSAARKPEAHDNRAIEEEVHAPMQDWKPQTGSSVTVGDRLGTDFKSKDLFRLEPLQGDSERQVGTEKIRIKKKRFTVGEADTQSLQHEVRVQKSEGELKHEKEVEQQLPLNEPSHSSPWSEGRNVTTFGGSTPLSMHYSTNLGRRDRIKDKISALRMDADTTVTVTEPQHLGISTGASLPPAATPATNETSRPTTRGQKTPVIFNTEEKLRMLEKAKFEEDDEVDELLMDWTTLSIQNYRPAYHM